MDPISAIQTTWSLIKQIKEFADYVQEAKEAPDKVKSLHSEISLVAPKIIWLADHLEEAVKPGSPQKALTELYSLEPGDPGGNQYKLKEGPAIVELRKTYEKLDQKLKPFKESKSKPRVKESKSEERLRKENEKQEAEDKALEAQAFTSQGGEVRHRSGKALFKRFLNHRKESNLYRRLEFPFSKEEIISTLETLHRQCTAIDAVFVRVGVDLNAATYEVSTKALDVGLQNLDLSKEAIQKIEAVGIEIKGLREDNRLDKATVEWLEIIAWLGDFRKAHQDNLNSVSEPAIDNDWFIKSEAFELWRAGRPWRLFVFGDPGSGKSVLSSQVIEHLRARAKGQPDTAVLYILLSFEEQKSQSIQAIYAALLGQIILHQGPQNVPTGVQEMWRECRGNDIPPPKDRVFKALRTEIGHFQRTFLVIDAIDGATDNVRKVLNASVKKLIKDNNPEQGSGKVSVLFTSRPLDVRARTTEKICNNAISDEDPCQRMDLEFFYKCEHSGSHGAEYHLCKKCVATGKYCAIAPHRLSLHPHDRLNFWLQPPREVIRKYIHALLDEQEAANAGRRASIATNDSASIDSDGEIRAEPDETTPLARRLGEDPSLREYIATAIVENAGGHYMLAKAQWEHLLESNSDNSIEDAVENMPRELGDSFEKTLDRMVSREVPEYKQQQAKRVVLWVSQGRGPLSLKQLRDAVAAEKDERNLDTEDLIATTRGMVFPDQNKEQIVRLTHRSAHDHLNTQKIRDKWFPDAQRHMAWICLKTLTGPKFAAAAQGRAEDEQINRRIKEVPFVAYAAQHWGFHAQTCQSDSEIARLVRKLLTTEGYLNSAVQISHRCETDHSTGWTARRGVNALHVAAWFGLESFFEELLRIDGIKLEAPEHGSTGRTPLIYACRGGRYEAVRKLIELGADGNLRDSDIQRGFTPLHHATLREQPDAIKALRENLEVDVNAMIMPQKRTALMEAAKRGFAPVVKALIWTKDPDEVPEVKEAHRCGYIPQLEALLWRNDINFDLQDREGNTALALAASQNSVKVIELLLMVKSVNIELGNYDFDASPLHWAADAGRADSVCALLEAGANPDRQNKYGGTAVRRAIDAGHDNVIKVFKDADLLHATGTEDNEGKNLLFAAAVNGHSFIVQDLLDAGFPVNTQSKDGRTALHDAAGNERIDPVKRMGVVRVLVGAGSDKTLEDSQSKTAADLAYEVGDDDIGEYIDPAGGAAARSHQDPEERPATWLARHGKVKILEERSKEDNNDLLIPDTEGETPLAIAISSRNYDCVDPIFAVHARESSPVDIPSIYNRTALHEAADSTRENLVRMLLDHNPKPVVNITDHLGRTPLSEAIKSQNPASIIALLEAGAEIEMIWRDADETLTAAIEADNLDVVKKLIHAGVQVDSSHRTLAQQKASVDIVDALEKDEDWEKIGNGSDSNDD